MSVNAPQFSGSRVSAVARLGLAVVLGLLALALVAYGLLLLLAIPTSDTATSSLVFTALLLLGGGAVAALLAALLYRAWRARSRGGEKT
jgi:hypothetical protein